MLKALSLLATFTLLSGCASARGGFSFENISSSLIAFLIIAILIFVYNTRFFQAISDFYERNEWLRWILFLPLTFALQAIAIILFSMINSDILHSSLFKFGIAPLFSGAITIYLIRILAPRWEKVWGYSLFCLAAFSFLCGIVLLCLDYTSEHMVGETIGAGLWTLSSFICNQYLNKKLSK